METMDAGGYVANASQVNSARLTGQAAAPACEEGASCEDGDPCTETGVCVEGVCHRG